MDLESVALEHGLSKDEYRLLIERLGREPDLTEIGVFSALWSEHCSYKSSKIHLKKFPTEGKHVVQGPGENAGVIDIGEDDCICFKMESHNHPSFIEPFEGAATGVGGILRDVFTMGARPIALLDLLRFGRGEDGKIEGKDRYIMNGVVGGIAHYGNCMGVPTVGGDTFFHPAYSKNPLINVMCVGILKKDKLFKGYASGEGNPVLYVGSKTGRDGIHGASMSSDVFSSDEEPRRSAVQVGDPFTEKLLLEACLELMKRGDVIVGIQDMGAAGISSSSFEMAERAGTGIIIHLDKVPVRADGMTPYELMLSESQERMLLVVEKGKERVAGDVFEKWGLNWACVGEVIKKTVFRGMYNEEKAFELPIELLSGDHAPCYKRPMDENPERIKRYAVDLNKEISELGNDKAIRDKLLALLSSPNICSKSGIFEQYDYMVRTNTVVHPGWDGALLRIKGTTKGIGVSASSKGRWCAIEPYLGAAYSAIDAATGIAVVGAKPLAITDCLNYGNPENPHVMYDFARSVDGITEVCRRIDMPVVSGNVSFYNETDGIAILPSPSIGVVGVIDNVKNCLTPVLKEAGNPLYLVTLCESVLTGSEYVSMFYPEHEFDGRLPLLDFSKLSSLIDLLISGARDSFIKSAHDVGLGGVVTELSKMVVYSNTRAKGLGIRVEDSFVSGRVDAKLFGEAPGMIIVEVKDVEKFRAECASRNLSAQLIGKVTDRDGVEFGNVSINSSELVLRYYTKL